MLLDGSRVFIKENEVVCHMGKLASCAFFEELEADTLAVADDGCAQKVAAEFVSNVLAISVSWVTSPWYRLPSELRIQILEVAAAKELGSGSARAHRVVQWSSVCRDWYQLMRRAERLLPLHLIKPTIAEGCGPQIRRELSAQFRPPCPPVTPQDIIFGRRYAGRGDELPEFRRIEGGKGDIFGLYCDEKAGLLKCVRITKDGEMVRSQAINRPQITGAVWGKHNVCVRLFLNTIIVVSMHLTEELKFAIIPDIKNSALPHTLDKQRFCHFEKDTTKEWAILCLQCKNADCLLVRIGGTHGEPETTRHVLRTIRGYDVAGYHFALTGILLSLPTRGLFCILHNKTRSEQIIQLCGQKRTTPTIPHFIRVCAANVSPTHIAIMWVSSDPNITLVSVLCSLTGHILDEGIIAPGDL